MRYFVAHLLSGRVKEYHGRLTRELASRYHTVPLNEPAPHITIKPPFEADEAGIQDVERTLRSFAHAERAVPITLHGFGRFGFRTLYLDVYRSAEATALARRCIQTLNENVLWMPRAPLEGNKLHASIARFLNRRQSRRMWRLLRSMHPHFETTFDNIVIFKKEGATWKVHALIAIQPKEEGFTGAPRAYTEEPLERSMLVS